LKRLKVIQPHAHLISSEELAVESYGDFLPRSLFGMFHLLFSALRSLYLAIYIYIFCPLHYDVVIVDQISFSIPILKHCADHVIFYCHFPDKFLAPKSSNPVRLLAYRYWFDQWEEVTIAKADRVLVNSRFTAKKYKEAFPGKTEPDVLYPGVKMIPVTETSLNMKFPWSE
jgi:alpha-1,3/alpha-1,6-mannosyltransferase